MARVKITSNYIRQIKKVLNSDNFMGKIGRQAVRRIREVTRSGKSIVTGRPLKSISSKWSQRRDRISEFNRTSKFYASGKSNLTFTGRLLNSLGFNILKSRLFGSGKRIEIVATGTHKSYKTSAKRQKRRVVENSKILEGQAKQGREIIGMDKAGIEKIKKLARREIRKEIRRSVSRLR